MEQYRLHFEVEQGAEALPTIMDIKAKDADQAKETARAYLAMVSSEYHAVTIYEPWRSMWRSSGIRIVRTSNT